MSYIAQKKAQHLKKGPETIFIYMGVTFLIAIAIELLILVIFHYSIENFEFQNTIYMIPILYFMALGGMSLTVGSKIREGELTPERVKDWIIGFVFIGILVGAVLGAYMW